MYYLKVDDNLYNATFTGKMTDPDWDRRETKTITFTDKTLAEVNEILHDDVEWHIFEPRVEERQKVDGNGQPIWKTVPARDENGNLVFDEENNVVYIEVPDVEDVDVSNDYDNSQYSYRGPITLYNDGSISVKMGKPTELEQAYELLYGGM